MEEPVADYRHTEAKRKNNPPATLAAEGKVPLLPKIEYAYSPRRAPELRFDGSGRADELPELLEQAQRRPLTEEEARTLADALRAHEPWLEWAGKREAKSFMVDPVALHIHERVSAQAILKVAARQDVERSLFADPEQEYNEAVQFYRHDVGWSNRLILGDSLQVMSSLARREDLAGKVQMIYMDPPYGIRFGSNFQPEVGRREVKDNEADLTREPEMVKAYRDTWQLGVHSYLSYLRERLIVARELLSEAGSIFIQIGDGNLHRTRSLMDEVFGAANYVSEVIVEKTSAQTTDFLPTTSDFILFYAKDLSQLKYRETYREKTDEPSIRQEYRRYVDQQGMPSVLADLSQDGWEAARRRFRLYRQDNIVSQRPPGSFPVAFHGQEFRPLTGYWKTGEEGMQRLVRAFRVEQRGRMLSYVRYLDDYSVIRRSNYWPDTKFSSRAEDKSYVVQTSARVIERCMLMTTDPGDLVLDPTCGSGTTSYVAEQWGRRWITIDTSRVAVAIARQRLLTAKYDYYRFKDPEKGVAGGFRYKTVPHVTLKSIAQNTNLDPIFTKHEPVLEEKLVKANAALGQVTASMRNAMRTKLALKQKREGKKSITDADRRRWQLPAEGKVWEHWEVPFDVDPEYPSELKTAVEEYRAAWRAKMDEVNACIAANAEPEELVDQPEKDKRITRVSGPFTVEAVQPPEMSLGEVKVIDTALEFEGAPEELEGRFVSVALVEAGESAENLEAYLSKMVALLKSDGVRFPDNKKMMFSRLSATYASGKANGIHAEGRWVNEGDTDTEPDGDATVGVVFGPQYGPITAKVVEEVIRPAARRYEDLVFAGFSFDAPAQAAIDEGNPRLRMHIAHVRPDVNPGMNGLLKQQPNSQLFTVFGRARRLRGRMETGCTQ